MSMRGMDGPYCHTLVSPRGTTLTCNWCEHSSFTERIRGEINYGKMMQNSAALRRHIAEAHPQEWAKLNKGEQL